MTLISEDPKAHLQTAIEELEVFTQPEISCFGVGKDGHLIAKENSSRLKKVINFARRFIAPLFSTQSRDNQDARLQMVKKAVLRARDIVQNYSPLIVKFKEGDETQRKLAESALATIERYNTIVKQDPTSSVSLKAYNYERYQLLRDREIQGQQIELPVTHIKYDSHPSHSVASLYPGHILLKELGLLLGNAEKENGERKGSALLTTHQSTLQFIIDTFHMKAIRMIEIHLQKSVSEIVPLVKKTIPKIDEDENQDYIVMQQLIEGDAGSKILVTGHFKRHASHSKFMTMPVPDSFRLSFQKTHTGFPYPSQHTGWALTNDWIDASPLRSDQTPLFHIMNQRRKQLAHRFLFDQPFIENVRSYFKIKREVFDHDRDDFLFLHQRMNQALQKGGEQEAQYEILRTSHDSFYQEAFRSSSSFDFLTQTQQQIVNFFIKQPMKALEEEWLGEKTTLLRTGSPQEKYQGAFRSLEKYRQYTQEKLGFALKDNAYIVTTGLLLSQAFQAVGLQYQSEKMGFSPPLLNGFERKLQACAFEQLISFLDECEQDFSVLDPVKIKESLIKNWLREIELIESINEDCFSRSFAIVNELECYFNARFYQGAEDKTLLLSGG